jgi:hypothetical protein
MANLNAEQTASLLSKLTHSFNDAFVFQTFRNPSVTPDQLPVLADYNYACNLKRASFPLIDRFSGAKQRYLFWGLIAVFRASFNQFP